MKVKTKSITQKNNLILKSYNTASTVHSLVLLDFEKGEAFMKSINNVNVRLKFDVEDYDSSICDKMITDASKFLTICKMHEELEVVNKDGKVVFVNGTNEFQLSYFEDVKIIPTSLFKESYEDEATVNLVITNELLVKLKKAHSYLGKDESIRPIYKHVFIEDGQIVCIDKEFNIVLQSTELENSCAIYRDVIDFILTLKGESANITLQITDKHYILSAYGGSSMVILPLITDVECPAILSEEFTQFCTHESNFKVNKEELLSFLQSVRPFTSELINNILNFKVVDGNLVLNTRGTDKITTNFPLISSTGLSEDFNFNFDGLFFARNVKNIEGEELTIELSNEMKMSKGVEKEAIMCRLYSDETQEKILFKRLSE